MQKLNSQAGIGIVTLIVSAILILYAIPTWVSSPSNVRNIILSPLFWPYTLAGITALIGLGLVLTSRIAASTKEDNSDSDIDQPLGGWIRLILMAIIMVLYTYGLSLFGMVWMSMIAFVAVAYLVQAKRPKTVVICAVVISFVLYLFFAHVAGVAIPQGDFVRLP